MKVNKTLTALIASAGLGLSGHAFAIGTAANTNIENEATLTFTVNSVPQELQRDTAEFVVDNKIDLNLVWNDGSATKAVPKENNVAISYRIYNAGNSLQSYKLTATHMGTDGTAVGSSGYSTEYQNGASPAVAFPATPGYTYSFYQEDGTTAGFQIGEDTNLGAAAITGDIAPVATQADLSDVAKGTIIYLVVSNILDDAFDADILGFELTADAYTSSTATTPNVAEVQDTGADIANQVQAVFADTGKDGEETTQSAIEIESAKLAITKSVEVISDPFSSSNPKAIPGATLRYTIELSNTGRLAADSVQVIEDLTKADDSFNENLVELDRATIDNLTTVDATSSTSQADFITNGVLTVDYNSIPAGSVSTPTTRTITFEIEIDDDI